jgi:hypothetical protein
VLMLNKERELSVWNHRIWQNILLFSELGVKVAEVLLLFELTNLNKIPSINFDHHHKQVVLVSFINSSCNTTNNVDVGRS